MDRRVADQSESRFAAYVQALTSVIGHPGRARPLKHYCVGLLAAEGRKSVEPIAAVTAPAPLANCCAFIPVLLVGFRTILLSWVSQYIAFQPLECRHSARMRGSEKRFRTGCTS